MLYKYFCNLDSPQEEHPVLAEVQELSHGQLQPMMVFEDDLQKGLQDLVSFLESSHQCSKALRNETSTYGTRL